MSITADVLQKQELIILRAHLGSSPFILFFCVFFSSFYAWLPSVACVP